MTQIRNLRWRIAALLALVSALSYLDRQSLPVVVNELQKSIPLSDSQYSQLQAMFLLAYGLMYAVGGRIMDRLGTRLGYVIMITWWSAAAALHGFVSSATGLGVARFLLGFGEGGGFPGSAKAVSEWFPPKERSFACGIFNTGSSIGAVIAPPLIASVVIWLNWRWVFFICGMLGFAWALAWWRMYDVPWRHKRVSSAEREYIAGASVRDPGKPVPWLQLLRYRQVWGLLLAKFLSDSAWYFFIFWLPKYLGDVRGLNIKQIGYYAWVPYAFAGFGSLVGGWFSSFLIRRQFTVDSSRKITLAMSAALMPVSLLIAASPLNLAIAFFSMAMLGHQFWSTIVQTLPADMFPSHSVGSVAGLLGAVGCLGGVLFNIVVGVLLSRFHSYSVVFLISGLLHPASFLAVLLIVRKIEPVRGLRSESIHAS
jgi:MFS transporter, ACS family, hexuronate transporter